MANPGFLSALDQFSGSPVAGESLGIPTNEIGRPSVGSSINPNEILAMLRASVQGAGGSSGMSGPMTTMQPSLTQPSMPPQFRMGPGQVAQGPFGSSGERNRADAQATINNLANFSGAVTDYMHQKKVREYSTTIEKVMNAQSGMTEAQSAYEQAQQALQQNPNDPNAQAAAKQAQENLVHNKEVLGTLGEDPKTAKILEKAFSVKLLGDDKGKASPEYQALQQALKSKDAKAKQEAGMKMMQKFMSTQPVRQQLSPQYQMMAQLIKDKILPSADVREKAKIDALSRIADATIQAQSRLTLGQMNKQAALLMREAILANGRLSTAAKVWATKEGHQNRMNEIWYKHNLAMSELNPLKQVQMINGVIKGIDDTEGTVKMDSQGNVISATGIQGRIRDTQKQIDDTLDSMGLIGRSFMTKQELLNNLDTILASKHPALLHGMTQNNINKLNEVKALQDDVKNLGNQIKALEVTKAEMNKAAQDAAARGVYGGNGAAGTDSSDSGDGGISGEPTSDGTDDATVTGTVNELERSFGYPPY